MNLKSIFTTLLFVCVTSFAFGESYTVNQTKNDREVIYNIEIPEGWEVNNESFIVGLMAVNPEQNFNIVIAHEVMTKNLSLDKLADLHIDQLKKRMAISQVKTNDAVMSGRTWKRIRYSVKPDNQTKLHQTIFFTVQNDICYFIIGTADSFSKSNNKVLNQVVKSFSLPNE